MRHDEDESPVLLPVVTSLEGAFFHLCLGMPHFVFYPDDVEKDSLGWKMTMVKKCFFRVNPHWKLLSLAAEPNGTAGTGLQPHPLDYGRCAAPGRHRFGEPQSM